MKVKVFFILLILNVFSCENSGQNYEKMAFTIHSTKWDLNPYKFSSFIADSVTILKNQQYSAVDYSCIGDIKNAIRVWPNNIKLSNGNVLKGVRDVSKDEIENFKRFSPIDAIPYILKKAQENKITIINEAHHIAQHRVFTTRLLKGLYNHGYRHIGLETLNYEPKIDSLLHKLKYPQMNSGYYTKEPQFGNLVREALKLGFKVFGYEGRDFQDPKEREIQQARNIENYIKKNPEGKTIIHCGYDHGSENNSSFWEKAMAGRLYEFTGIDPLTINQTEHSESSKNHLYRTANVTEPSIYINENGDIYDGNIGNLGYDIAVFHPLSENDNRPKWLLYGERQFFDFDFSDLDKLELPWLIFAYRHEEKIGHAVPYDIQESKNKKVKLVLEPGDYNIIIWNKKNNAYLTKFSTF